MSADTSNVEQIDAPFILAIREEGLFVNCYLAPNPKVLPPGMDRHLIGTINRRAMHTEPKLFEEWKELMKKVLAVAVRESIGIELDVEKMRERQGPDNDRSSGGGH